MHRAGNITARVKSDRKALGPNNIDLRQVGFLMKPSRRFLTLITKIHRQQMLYCVVVIRYRTRDRGHDGRASTRRTHEYKREARGKKTSLSRQNITVEKAIFEFQ